MDGHRLPSDLPDAAVQLLLSRGIGTAKALVQFLQPTGLPYPADLLAGVESAVPRLARAARSRETVAVFGDFDVDGITGTAILTETLERLGAKVRPLSAPSGCRGSRNDYGGDREADLPGRLTGRNR